MLTNAPKQLRIALVAAAVVLALAGVFVVARRPSTGSTSLQVDGRATTTAGSERPGRPTIPTPDDDNEAGTGKMTAVSAGARLGLGLSTTTRPRPAATTTTVDRPATSAGRRPSEPGTTTVATRPDPTTAPPAATTTTTTAPVTTTTAAATTTTTPAPSPHQTACAELGRSAIGDPNPTDRTADVLAAVARFRAQDAAMQAAAAADPALGNVLVCAGPLKTFKNDLVIQDLYAAGREYGTLIAGRRATDPVIRVTRNEFLVFTFRASGAPDSVNFVGVPVRRETRYGLTVIRTTYGGAVMQRADSIGVPVVFGAWDLWSARGAEFGMPVSVPYGFGIGAKQSFRNVVIQLPKVTSAAEAAATPASAYQVLPLEGNVIGGPLEPNTLVKVDERSYYVGSDQALHWVPTTDAWMCARYDLRAPEYPKPDTQIDVSLLATLPFGEVFSCKDWR